MCAFSLLEVLAVLAVFTILISLVAPAASSVLRGSHLAQAGRTLNEQLTLARQLALSRNCRIEVRFYSLTQPGETSPGKFRALQLFEVRDTGNAAPAGKIVRLPESVIIDSGDTLSTLLNSSRTPPAGTVTEYPCRVFRFLPDGSTDLSALGTEKWFLTLHAGKDGDQLRLSPVNFITLQLEPANGNIRTFRP